MAKEVPYSQDKRVIFRETFNSSYDVRRNSGTPTALTFLNGVASFNGSAYITYPSSIGKKYKGITWRARVYFNNDDAIEVFLTYGTDNANTSHHYIFNKLSTNIINLYIGIDSKSISSTTILQKQTWYDLAFTHALGGSVKLYINGINDGSGTVVGGTLINSNFVIGRHSSGTGRYLDGQIDLVEIYNEALTAEEVSLLYKNSLYVEPRFSNVLLDINPELGAIFCKLGTTITNANVTISRDGSKYVEYYNGSNAKLTLGNIGTVKALSFWLYNNGTDQSVLTVDGGTTNLTISSNALSTLGTDRYVNNLNTETLSKGWNYVTIISTTGLTASNLIFGNAGANYFKGFLGRKIAMSNVITFEQHVNFYNATKHKFSL